MVLGSHMTEEQRMRQSVAQKGHPASGPEHQTPETRAKISASLMGNTRTLGYHPSEETLAKLSAALIGNTRGLGYHHTEEAKAKMSTARRGRKQTPETIAARSAGMMGHAVSPEARAKSSAAQWKGGRKLAQTRHHAMRRLLGYNTLNSWFLGCEGHHINPDDVIYMPKVLHRSIYHNQTTGQGMAEMNALAGQYLMENWT